MYALGVCGGGPGRRRRRRGRPGRRGAKTVWAAPLRRGGAAPGGQPSQALEDDEKPFGGRRGVGRALLDAGARELGVSCWGPAAIS